VRKAAIAYGLAGLAAAGLGLSAAQASGGPTADIGWISQSQDCSSARGAGEAIKTRPDISVGGSPVNESRTSLKRGAKVTTNRYGRGVICLRDGNWECDVRPETELRVFPPKTRRLLIRLADGHVTCVSPSRGETRLETKGVRLLIGAQGRLLAGTHDDNSTTAPTGGKSFSIAVVKGRTVVKFRRGSGVVAKKRTTLNAVVLGRGEQSVVPTRGFPSPPSSIDLTKAERAVFTERERALPKETDRSAPKVEIGGPHDPSSVRSATFTFNASEAATFSCALDDTDFRLCTTPFDELKRVAPGRHTFAVRATDAAGNTGVARYSWTVDGSRIAFVSFRHGNPEIHTVDPDGQTPLRITENEISDENPDWSPDRRRLVFDRLVGDNLDIYVMNADGSGATRLTEDRARDRNPTWSPNGTLIAFESFRDNGNREIYVMNADGSGERRLTTDPGEDFDPTWAPDSKRLAFASTRDGNYEIYSMNADGSGLTRLTNHPAPEFGPSWSPDGRRIAFHGQREDQGRSHNIFVMNPDGSDVTRLTQTSRNDTNPSWAPDSRHIVFHSDREGGEEQLYVLDVVTRMQTRVPAETTRANFSADW
jgi:Tol biopolymer transport system component